jgi:uncharacterized protein with NRDE domain
MCTVTFLPRENGDFIFTTNRDEAPTRETISPKIYVEDGMKLLYPKDVKAGGTWIALSEEERLVCLLNGGYEKHKHTGDYSRSRGLIVKEALKAENIKWFAEDVDLEGVEPFTLIAIDWSFLTICVQLIWDGKERHIRVLSHQPKIWSSSTLYDSDVRKEREAWFSELLQKDSSPSFDSTIKFHLNDSKGAKESSIKMKRDGVETMSVTSIVKNDFGVVMFYKDLLSGEEKSIDLFAACKEV